MPYDAVPKAICAQESPGAEQSAGGDSEDHWDRQLKKFENGCPKPKLNLKFFGLAFSAIA